MNLRSIDDAAEVNIRENQAHASGLEFQPASSQALMAAATEATLQDASSSQVDSYNA